LVSNDSGVTALLDKNADAESNKSPVSLSISNKLGSDNKKDTYCKMTNNENGFPLELSHDINRKNGGYPNGPVNNLHMILELGYLILITTICINFF
jgi:hypothetical protein